MLFSAPSRAFGLNVPLKPHPFYYANSQVIVNRTPDVCRLQANVDAVHPHVEITHGAPVYVGVQEVRCQSTDKFRVFLQLSVNGSGQAMVCNERPGHGSAEEYRRGSEGAV